MNSYRPHRYLDKIPGKHADYKREAGASPVADSWKSKLGNG